MSSPALVRVLSLSLSLSLIIEKYNLTTTTKTNTIDVARAVQHSTAVLYNTYIKHFDNVVHRMNKIDDKKKTGKRWQEVPPEYVYNYNEIVLE